MSASAQRRHALARARAGGARRLVGGLRGGSLVGRATVAVLAASVLLVPAACGNQRTVSAFCGELKSGTDQMRSNVEGAPSSWTSQFAAAMSNIGAFTQMLDKLEAHAPDEIEPDMKASVQAWDKQREAASNAASNPLGALAQSLTASLFASASMRSVDQYAQEHCGMQVFGTVGSAVAAPSTDSADGEPSPTPSPTPTLDVSGPAVDLNLLTSLACPAGGSDLLGITAAPEAVVECSDNSLGLVDLTTGEARTVDVGYPGSAHPDPSSTAPTTATSKLVLAGDEVAWTDTLYVPAAGLQLPTWSMTLHLVNVSGSKVADVLVVASTTVVQGFNPLDSRIVDARGNDRGVVVTTWLPSGATGETLTAVDLTGQVTWTTPTPVDSVDVPAAGIVLLQTRANGVKSLTAVKQSDGSPLLPAIDGLQNNSWSEQSGSDGCGLTFQAGTANDTAIQLVMHGAASATDEVSASVSQRGDEQSRSTLGVTSLGTVSWVNGTGLRLTGWDAGVRWTIPSTVLGGARAAAAGRWVLVNNASGAPVVVDAATGQEGTNAAPVVTTLLKGNFTSLRLRDSQGDAWFSVEDGGLLKVPATALCG